MGINNYTSIYEYEETSMGYCKDCKHWQHNHDTYNRQWNECNNINFVRIKDKVGDNLAAIYIEEDASADVGLTTGALFGCVMFEQKKVITS